MVAEAAPGGSLRVPVSLGLKSKMNKTGTRQALEREITKELGQTGSPTRILNDGSVTFAWFMTNRFIPLKETVWKDETAKTKKFLNHASTRAISQIHSFAISRRSHPSISQYRCEVWFCPERDRRTRLPGEDSTSGTRHGRGDRSTDRLGIRLRRRDRRLSGRCRTVGQRFWLATS